ncbi:hypothetical protein LIPSTDRAFT_106224 [Lipomyces starkeyi NRRL Y-11557]|uniref:Uncharacterized protein n=1 Tax=Lipomyces starkeyi NRRL Y-11557 TaxID=675824 RepID=A0A1E3Q3T5_LIPST|nr:hypothetical protein LIPSTDRAFT_106224 [Lipomyces starkeyi NRRL Y-11557]
MNRDSADDSEADTNSEDNDSWYGRLMTDARGILDGSDSSDRLDSSNSSDAGNEDEDIATSDETGPVEEQKSWVQRCLEELFPIGSGGLAKAHMACAVSVADGSDPSMVPLFSREFMADEYTGQQAAFVPCGFNPAFGTFSGVKAPQCLDGTIDGIVRDTGRKNGNFEFVVFGSLSKGCLGCRLTSRPSWKSAGSG